MSRKKTHEEFIKEVYDLVGNEYEVIGKYETAKMKVKIRHSICGNTYDVLPLNLLRGRTCPYCLNRNKISHNDFVRQMKEIVGDEYELQNTYKHRWTKITIKHNACNHIYEVLPCDFLNGQRCPKCNGTMKKNTDVFKEEVFKLVGNEYVIIGDYVNSNENILVKHNECGYEYSVRPSHFLRGSRCPKCSQRLKTNDDFLKEIYSLVKDEYTILETYKSAHKKLNIKHNLCGNIWLVTPRSFLNGTRCPECNESKGETKIRLYLDKHKVINKSQYKFDDCRNKNPLPFDFAIFNSENELECLIEYDGEFHFEAGRYSKDKQKMKNKLKLQQKHDQIKNEYCKKNNIKLIRIPYWDFDRVEDILDLELNNIRISRAS